MSNLATCTDCGHTDTRGRMHIRSRAFTQVAVCPACMAFRARLAELTRAVHVGVAA